MRWKVLMFGVVQGHLRRTEIPVEVHVVGQRRLTEVMDDEQLKLDVRAVHTAQFPTNLRLELQRDVRAFSENYKEVDWTRTEGFEVKADGPPRCLYSGNAYHDDNMHHARASLCGGKLRAVVHAAKSTYDIVYQKTLGSYVIRDSKRRRQRPHQFKVLHPDRRRRDPRRYLGGAAVDSYNCTTAPNKTVEIVAFNDQSRFANLGEEVESDTASIFAFVHDIWFAPPLDSDESAVGSRDEGYGVMEPGIFDCTVEPKLLGQVTWRDENPPEVAYVQGADCASHCCQCGGTPQRCGPTEVSAPCLLSSFSSYVETHREMLKKVFNTTDIDNAHLLSHRDFAEGTLGVAWVGGMCSLDASAAIEQVRHFSRADTARIVAHELGHLFGMHHDDSPSLMFRTADAEPAGKAIQFSKRSKKEIHTFISEVYGTSHNGACLENDPATTRGGPICGDGFVDVGEECDPGLAGSHCCGAPDSETYACQLLPGCECVDGGMNACCKNGTILSQGTVCRSPLHGTCDFAEVCDGVRAECPVDSFESPGTACADVHVGPGVVPGLCFSGDCKSVDDECLVASNGKFAFACAKTLLGGVTFPTFEPTVSNGASLQDVFGPGQATRTKGCREIVCASTAAELDCTVLPWEAANGVPCVSDGLAFGQCAPNGEGESTCVHFNFMKRYHWDEDECHCVDEAGTVIPVADEALYCQGFDRLCRSAAPTASTFPTLEPTIEPSEVPTISKAPSPAPTTPCERTGDEYDDGWCGSCDADLIININTDLYSWETKWTFEMADPSDCPFDASAKSDDYSLKASHNHTVILRHLCRSREYTFRITDKVGDGICCDYGKGNYSVWLSADNAKSLVATGSDFGYDDITTFVVPQRDCTNFTIAPSVEASSSNIVTMPTFMPRTSPPTLVPRTSPPTFMPVGAEPRTSPPTFFPVGADLEFSPSLEFTTPPPNLVEPPPMSPTAAPSPLPSPGPTPMSEDVLPILASDMPSNMPTQMPSPVPTPLPQHPPSLLPSRIPQQSFDVPPDDETKSPSLLATPSPLTPSLYRLRR